MKIAIVYKYKYPEHLGGGERRFFEIFKRFNFPIDWYTQSNDIKHREGNFNIIPLMKDANKKSVYETFLWSIAVLRIPFGKYDVIHVGQMPFFHIFTLLIKYKIFLLLGINRPILAVDWWEYWGEHWNRFIFPFNMLGRAVEKFILRYLDNIVVLSDKTRNDIKYFTSAKVNLIHNGIDLKLINQAKRQKKADFVYFGRLEEHKKVDLSIEVFNELLKLNPDYKFIIIGDGPFKPQLELLTYKLNSSIFFTGRLNDNVEMYSIIKGSDCMLFFGSQEGGASIALFEANACGIPVAHSFSENGIDRKLITEKNGFFFNDFNVESIAKEIHSHINDSVRKDNLRKSCYDYVKDKDWSHIAGNYKEYFNKLYKDG